METSNDQLTAAFSQVLRRRRRDAGLTQEQLSERADISTRHISFLETGRRQPTLSVMVALCGGLGVPLAEFAGEVESAWLATRSTLEAE